MSEPFDPYYTWLGIPPDEQPPDHYRLLGIRRFEDNLEVIDNAADRQMAHLRSFATGKHAAESQRLLNQASTARVCLLDASKKAAYDNELRDAMAAAQARAAAIGAPPSPPARHFAPPMHPAMPQRVAPRPVHQVVAPAQAPVAAATAPIVASRVAMRYRRSNTAWIAPVILLAGIGVAAVVAILAIGRRDDPGSKSNVAQKDSTKQPSSRQQASSAKTPIPAAAPSNGAVSSPAGEIGNPPPSRKGKDDTTVESPEPPADSSKRDSTDKPESPAKKEDQEKKLDTDPMPNEPEGDLGSLLKKGEDDIDEEPSAARTPVPDEAKRKAAEAEIRKLYADDFAKKKAADVAITAGKLLKLARESHADPVVQYVLFELARRTAADIADATTSLDAASELAMRFDVDSRQLKARTLVTVGKGPLTHAMKPAYYRTAWPVVQDLLRHDRFELVPQLTAILLPMAQAYQDRQAAAEIKQAEKDASVYKKHYEVLVPGLQSLKADPKQPAAHREIDKFYCFVKGDWPRGLPHLAKGDDEKLRTLAATDIAMPIDPQLRVELADRWRVVADAAEDKHRKIEISERAAWWYQQARPQLQGLAKTKVEQTLKDLSLKPRHHADAVQFAGHWYKLFTQPATWAEAKAKCELIGGYLVCIETKEENAFAYRLAGRIVKNAREVWIGATDEHSEGNWEWANGSAFLFYVWDPGQPDNAGGEHYVQLWPRGWNDRPPGHRAMYICEWDR